MSTNYREIEKYNREKDIKYQMYKNLHQFISARTKK